MTNSSKDREGKKVCKCKMPMKVFDPVKKKEWCGECYGWIKTTKKPSQQDKCECIHGTGSKIAHDFDCPMKSGCEHVSEEAQRVGFRCFKCTQPPKASDEDINYWCGYHNGKLDGAAQQRIDTIKTLKEATRFEIDGKVIFLNKDWKEVLEILK